ncbi:hypothetical protein [Sporomusa aerivorans]|uniref:hypothetical protein n=1 Tax=Sporomusa aerivorans TaxID=204936 RepID=UPI003529FEAF
MKFHSNMCVARGKLIVIHVFAGILMALFFGLIFGYLVLLLWNNLLPDIFGWKEITYWQGVGLVIMFRLLFGSHSCYTHEPKWRSNTVQEDGYSFPDQAKQDEYYQAWWEQEGQAAFRRYAEKQGGKTE